MLNFIINSDEHLSQLIIEKGITSWQKLVAYIKTVPYGRNSNRIDSTLVISENKGTCSSKHALLKRIADLNGHPDIELIIGIYKMNHINTPKIGSILLDKHIEYIPEAHCYLRHKDKTIDVTSNSSDFDRIKKDIIIENKIVPDQVGPFKVAFHQDFIKNWIITEKLHFSFDEIWKIRELCIKNLSN